MAIEMMASLDLVAANEIAELALAEAALAAWLENAAAK